MSIKKQLWYEMSIYWNSVQNLCFVINTFGILNFASLQVQMCGFILEVAKTRLI